MGRGEDLEFTLDVNTNGGLHVLVAFIPPNIRVEEQAFGRASRKGLNGSG
jgi:hypothetical protein